MASYLLYIFLMAVIILMAVYIVFRINTRKTRQRPLRHKAPLTVPGCAPGTREIIFWPREKDMPDLGKSLKADMSADPELGPLIMVIASHPVFKLLCAFNIMIAVICLDALLGGVLILGDLTHNYLDLDLYHPVFAAILIFMLIWSGYNLYRVYAKILFYEHGLTLGPWQNAKYDYNDLEQADINPQQNLCRLKFNGSPELVFDGAQYANFAEKINFWKQNLMWTG